jgi:hypothetical protein
MKLECPLPRYYFCHAAFALLIAVLLAPGIGFYGGLCCGAMFYISREWAQYEFGLLFDWPGLLAPLLTCAIAAIIYSLV